ncbi:methyl-accepting chemotaxis protein [Halomonas fontilapidosi]|uniref:Methyl-accepting chemotaxis protein n=1 Tax=Halomonas fontilapidosi TaxID=616675 RepID=A0A7W5GX12_9GAMM|nr:methyl-accepting chemotaxis protein [Halomonas fontilapidosi]
MPSQQTSPPSPRAGNDHRRRIDRLMWMPAGFHLALCLAVGAYSGTLLLAIAFGAIAFPLVALLQWRMPGHGINGFVMAALFMGLSALLIEQSGGQIEAHFSIFIMLSALILYSNWRVIVFGAAVIAVHHALFTWLQYLGAVSLYAGMGEAGHQGAAALLVCLAQHGGAVVAQAVVLGYLAQVLNRMVQDGLRVATFAEQAGQGRLDIGFSEAERRRPALAAIDSMQQRVAATLLKAQDTGQEVGALSDALFSGQANLRLLAEQNAAQVERVSASATQLSATTRESASEASRVRELAGTAADQARGGQQEVLALQQAMQGLEANAAGIAELLRDIDEITFQTNLLALNASVEAARAGEEGRGFAVVAGEVRKLSQRTRDTAEQIRSRIRQNDDSVQAGVNRTRTAGDAMARVLSAFDEVAQRLREIDGASHQQHQGIEELEGSVLEMQASLQKSSSALDGAHATAEKLADAASELMAAVGSFTLGVSSNERPPAASPRRAADTVG